MKTRCWSGRVIQAGDGRIPRCEGARVRGCDGPTPGPPVPHWSPARLSRHERFRLSFASLHQARRPHPVLRIWGEDSACGSSPILSVKPGGVVPPPRNEWTQARLPIVPQEWRDDEPRCLLRRYIEHSATLISTIYQDSHEGANARQQCRGSEFRREDIAISRADDREDASATPNPAPAPIRAPLPRPSAARTVLTSDRANVCVRPSVASESESSSTAVSAPLTRRPLMSVTMTVSSALTTPTV